jgi:hypothetical protein
MKLMAVAVVAVIVAAAYTGSHVNAPSAAPTPVPATAAATFFIPSNFASACGTASDRVARTATADATFLLSSPGRPPLKITFPGPGPVDGIIPAGYICLLLEHGTALPTFGGLIGPQMSGYLPEGTFPATAARPAPTGFTLPQVCAYVEPPVVRGEQTEWSLDCGAANNSNARGTLAPALAAQGWAQCASGLATAQWRKADVMISVVESTLAPGEYLRVAQLARLISPC